MISRLSKLRKPLYRLGVVLGMALLFYQIILGFQAVRLRYIQELDLSLLFLSTGFVTLGILQQVFSWVLIMRIFGIKLPALEGAAGYIFSFLSRYIPGSIWGYLGRGEWLWQHYQVNYSISNTASLVEVGLIILTDLWVIGFSLIFPGGIQVILVYVALSLLGILILWWIFSKLLNSNWAKLHVSPNWPVGDVIRPRNWLAIAGLLVSNWLYYGLAVYLIGQALGLWKGEFEGSRWISLIGQYGQAWLGAFLALFLPAGLGLREFLLTRALSAEGGLLMVQASALSVITRFLFTLAELITVIIALLWKAISIKDKRKQ